MSAGAKAPKYVETVPAAARQLGRAAKIETPEGVSLWKARDRPPPE